MEGNENYEYQDVELREIGGIGLSQKSNNQIITHKDLENIVTKNQEISDFVKEDLILATITLKYTPSNSITLTHNGVVLGVGAGQQNRLDCIKLAGNKTNLEIT